MMKKLLASLLVLTASGCPDVDVDSNEVGGGPTVEFDPARSLAAGARFIPFPNDLVRDPMTGKINLGEQACESATAKALREGVLNTLDGFGTYQLPIQVTFTHEVDLASLQGRVFVYPVRNAAGPMDPTTAMPVPVLLRKSTTLRFNRDDCTAPETVNAVLIIPTIPLSQKTTYVVALKRGIRATNGAAFGGSYTWGLVSANENPVTVDEAGNVVADRTPLEPSDPAQLAQLLALDMLWKGHAPALMFLDASPAGIASRTDLLVAFAFTTQTTTDQLDPTVATSPAGQLSTTGFLAPFQSIAAATLSQYPSTATAQCGGELAGAPAQCLLKLTFGQCKPFTTGCAATSWTVGNSICQAPPSPPNPALEGIPPGVYDCAQVADILATKLTTVNYQTQVDNSLAAVNGVTPTKLQGPWSDPVNPTSQGSLELGVVATVPAGAAPTGGWPVVIFGHGLTGAKENVFAVAGRLSRMGFATVAIDNSQHGSRAVRTSTAAAVGCRGHCFDGDTDTAVECETIAQCQAGETCGNATLADPTKRFLPPNPTDAPQCYAQILSTDLTNTRDNIRQTVLDIERLVNALKTCSGATCGVLKVDPTRIFYAGISLGGIIGTTVSAISPDIKAAALNVPAVGWLDILENTDTLSLRCTVVNGLIDAGILMGDKWAGGDTGLCLTDAWKTQPGYATFSAIARWILDPADPANFALRLRGKKHLIQKVIDDTVVPNIATDREVALTGVDRATAGASAYNPGMPTVESAHLLTNPMASKEVRYLSSASHLYVHSTLLRPGALTTPGFMGIWRMQIDLAQFLDNQDDANN